MNRETEDPYDLQWIIDISKKEIEEYYKWKRESCECYYCLRRKKSKKNISKNMMKIPKRS